VQSKKSQAEDGWTLFCKGVKCARISQQNHNENNWPHCTRSKANKRNSSTAETYAKLKLA